MPTAVTSAVESAVESTVAAVTRHRSGPLVLELDLTDGVIEQPPSDPVGRAMTMRRTVLRHVVEALRAARDDQRVRGLVVRLGGRRIGLATAQELRAAVADFRAAGKWAVAWSESFGEFGAANVPYYVAAACDEIWLMPTGSLGLVGIGVDVTFLHDALAKAGVEMQVGKRYEYKNAANIFTHTGFTPEHREATERLAVSAMDTLVADVAAARDIPESEVRAAVDEGPLLATEALARRLVDRLGYRDEVYDDVRRRAGDGAELLFLDRYRKHAARARALRRMVRRSEPVVALVPAVGGIRTGRSGRGGPGGVMMGSDTVSAALRAAVKDDAVRAIVLRVDSPGGSAVASDVIWRHTLLAKRAGKPVVVSMGDVAGSGGYYVAMAADAIVAQPGTITGSIGVLAGKPVTRALLDRVGLTTDSVEVGRHAGMFSTRRHYADEEWDRLQRYLDVVYLDFTTKVAEGRRMTQPQVHEVAQGRVWSGTDALERGLVDHLGGLELAVELARDLARLAAGKGVVREFPRISPVARLKPAASSEDPAAAAVGAGVAAWGSLAGLAAALGLPAAGPLAMPFVPVLR